MTRKDSELIANAIREAGEDTYVGESTGYEFGRAVTANRIADSLTATNPQFDRSRFLRACGVEG